MKRLAVTVCLLALGLAGPGRAAASPRSAVKLAICRSALLPADRDVRLVSQITADRATVRMAIRVDSYQRLPGRGYVPLRSAYGFGRWYRQPRPYGSVFRYIYDSHPDTVPATVRFRVGFRWYERHGKIERTVYRLTPPCRQRDLRPDLSVRGIRVEHGRRGNHDRYAVTIRNAGATAAAPFTLRLAFSGGLIQTWDLTGGLGPGRGATRTLTGGPACAGGAPTATVDSGAVIDESNEQNNSLVAACPAF